MNIVSMYDLNGWVKGCHQKKAKFGDFILKGGRGSFQKPNFFHSSNLGHFWEEGGGQNLKSY